MGIYHYAVRLSWNGPGSPGYNIWDIRQQAIDPTAELNSAIAAIGTFYGSIVGDAQVFPDGYSIQGPSEAIEVQDRSIEAVTGFTHGQSGAGADFSGLNQMIMTIRTSSATRRGRGRKYLGPANALSLDTDGTPTPGAVTSVQDAADALLASSTGAGGWAIGVYSSVDGLFRDAVQLTARNYFASMRSRRD
jgi:hypothetical protein